MPRYRPFAGASTGTVTTTISSNVPVPFWAGALGAARYPHHNATAGQQGTKRVDIICPGFVADCLETLEEIAIECRHVFLTAGGKTFHYIPCLNDSPDWIATLGAICQQHLAGWLDPVAIPKAPSY